MALAMTLLKPQFICLLLWATTTSAAVTQLTRKATAVAAADSEVVPELLGQAAVRNRNQPESGHPIGRTELHKSDPYDEFAEPRRLDWPSGHPAELIRRKVLWQIASDPELARRQRELERLGPLKPHSRYDELDGPDPYSEFASAAYYQFVRAILDMRNRASGFDKSSGINEFFEDPKPPTSRENSTATERPTSPQPTITPSPPVQVCPPMWRLGAGRCKANATTCFRDADCKGTACCFDGCRLRCLEPDLLVKHVCRDYMNSTVFPGDFYMYQREQICTCDPLGRPVACKDKKPCVDIISSSLFKLPIISNKTAKLQKPESTTREKIYDALQEAFKHVKSVY